MQHVHCRAVGCQPHAAVPSLAPRPAVSTTNSSKPCAAQAVNSRPSAAPTPSSSRNSDTPPLDSSQWGELTSAAPAKGRRTAAPQPAEGRRARSSSSSRGKEEYGSSSSSWYSGSDSLAQSSGFRSSRQSQGGTSGDPAARGIRQPASSKLAPDGRSSSNRDQDHLNAASRGVPAGAFSRSSSAGRPSSGPAAKQQHDKMLKKKSAFLPPSNQPCCYGCGAPLQTEVAAAAGYVLPDRFALKQKHRQLHQVLCARCSGLCNGAMIPAVQDFTQKAWAQQQAALLQQQQQQQQQLGTAIVPQRHAKVAPAPPPTGDPTSAAAGDSIAENHLELLGKVLITPEQLREKIMEVRSVKAVVVLLVDLLDASGTLMSKVRDMVGNNPIILVGTKMDLLPAGCRPKDVAEWLAESAVRRRLQVASCHLVSSHKGEGIAAVTAKICRERKGRDVFVIGAANVGKSAFVRAMLKEMSSLTGGNFDAAAMSMSRYLPVESAMPGTTLGLIALKAFETGGTLYDTPGVHLHHRIPHMLTPDELKLLHPRRRLTAFSPPTPMAVTIQQAEDEDATGVCVGPASSKYTEGIWVTDPATGTSKPRAVSATYIWGGLVRVDVEYAPPSTSLAFYGPKSMRVYDMPLLGADSEVQYNPEVDDGYDGGGEQELFCQESVRARGGLVPHRLLVQASPIPTSACLADVAISGLPGWVGVSAPFTKQDIRVTVWAPRGVEVFLRPPLPCPAPTKPRGSDEPEELMVIGGALDVAESDQEWQAHKGSLGLGPLSAQDEEVVKMLLFGDEGAGLEGIVDVEDDYGDVRGDGQGDDDLPDHDDHDSEGATSDRRLFDGVGRIMMQPGPRSSRRLHRRSAAAADLIEHDGGRAQGDDVLQQFVVGVPVSRVGGSSSSSGSGKGSRVSGNADQLPTGKGRRDTAGAVAFDDEFGNIFVDSDAAAGVVAVHDHDGEVHVQGALAVQPEQSLTSSHSLQVPSSMVRRRRKLSSRR